VYLFDEDFLVFRYNLLESITKSGRVILKFNLNILLF
jgi:hypothetical protein